jgi:two-component system sensor histidine kinase and response regulator WspE
MKEKNEELSGSSMLELFRAEAETQTAILTAGLLELERGTTSSQCFEVLMRAAHSLKGAARIINLPPAAAMAHALEDCFAAAQEGLLSLRHTDMDLLLSGVDILAQLAKRADLDEAANRSELPAESMEFLDKVAKLLGRGALAEPAGERKDAETVESVSSESKPAPAAQKKPPSVSRPRRTGGAVAGSSTGRHAESAERVLRLAPENLNRLLGLAGESLVESRWLRPFADSFQQLKRHQMELAQQLESLKQSLTHERMGERSSQQCADALRQLAICQKFLAERVQDLDMFDRRSAQLSQRLYLEVLRTRMRPFSDGVRRFPRMVRDLARSLGKQVILEINGEATQVDREILERLETPLAHLLRNAVDHGCESPERRKHAGKPAECTVRIEARHSAGVLLVTVSDDGDGVDFEQLRRTIVKKRFVTSQVAARLTEAELIEFLFLPGFSLKSTVTEISGRGFGLDIVQNMVRSVRGGIRVSNQPGQGVRVQLQLPLTLSVLRALLVQIGGEPYAIPLGQISRTLKLPRSSVQSLDNRRQVYIADQQIGVVTAHEILGCSEALPQGDEFSVVVLGERTTRCGLIVDRLLGERELVVQQLDPRLGKVKEISAAALMEDGTPVLILDVEETIRSIEKLLAEGRFGAVRCELSSRPGRAKRVLAVDDSLTVREMERQLLSNRGYQTDVAADGVEAWGAVRSGAYDLVITDLDMPRMDGIELTSRIKNDPHLASIPVLIISYKDRQEDRVRGLDAGADYYLAKGSFQDKDLLQAVQNLIGEPEAGL